MYGLFFESQDGIVDVHVIGVKIHTHTHLIWQIIRHNCNHNLFLLFDRSET